MRHIRSWICSCCRVSYRRYRGNDSPPSCRTCQTITRPGRSYYSQKKNCKHQRRQSLIRTFKKRYYSKIRNIGGNVLSISPITKKIWRLVDQARTRPAFQRRAQLFLESIKKDCWNAKEGRFARGIDSNGNINRSRGGITSVPQLVLDEKRYSLLGQYTSGAPNHEIMVTKDRPLNEMKATLLHETLHFIDHLSNTPGNHDSYFCIRLSILKNIFKIK